MPEGLTNTPAAFQRFMNDTFADIVKNRFSDPTKEQIGQA